MMHSSLVGVGVGVGVGDNGAHVPAFLAKLWRLVEDPNTDDFISWSEGGNSFVIRNQGVFSRELLPLYYKHNNMASFVRQLNMYGFHKVVSVESGGLKLEKDEMEFAHPFFLKGNEGSLELIKRKVPAPRGDSSDNRLRTSLSAVDNSNLQRVLGEVRGMRGKQENMDTKLAAMKRENETLWRELASLRQKLANQTTILSKILQFLVGVMSSRSQQPLPFKRTLPLMLNSSSGGTNTGGEEGGPSAPKRVKGQQALPLTAGPVIKDVTELLAGDDSSDSFSSGVVDSPKGSAPTSPSGNATVSTGGKTKGGKKRTAVAPSAGNVQATTNSAVASSKPVFMMQAPSEAGGQVTTGDQGQEDQGAYCIYVQDANGQPVKVQLSFPQLQQLQLQEQMERESEAPATASQAPVNNPPTTSNSTGGVSRTEKKRLSRKEDMKSYSVVPDKEELGSHLNIMDNGLENLRELLKGDGLENGILLGVRDHDYSQHENDYFNYQLFNESTGLELNLDNNKSTQENSSNLLGGSSSELVSYNPSLFELAEDDHFFSDPSLLLDDELEHMLSTPREQLIQPPATSQ